VLADVRIPNGDEDAEQPGGDRTGDNQRGARRAWAWRAAWIPAAGKVTVVSYLLQVGTVGGFPRL
jgi:hypothetical protein